MQTPFGHRKLSPPPQSAGKESGAGRSEWMSLFFLNLGERNKKIERKKKKPFLVIWRICFQVPSRSFVANFPLDFRPLMVEVPGSYPNSACWKQPGDNLPAGLHKSFLRSGNNRVRSPNNCTIYVEKNARWEWFFLTIASNMKVECY